MKKIKLILVFSIIALVTVVACSKDDTNVDNGLQEKTENSQFSLRGAAEIISPESFTKSVAIVKLAHAVSIPAKTTKDEVALVIEVFNFDDNYSLNEAFVIDNIEYSDNGRFNDKVANDGVYTSVQTFTPSEENQNAPEEEDVANVMVIADMDDFLYMDDLKETLAKVKPKVYAQVGCDIVTRDCPQTTWYNSCWFSDECTCVYLENCELTIGIEIGG